MHIYTYSFMNIKNCQIEQGLFLVKLVDNTLLRLSNYKLKTLYKPKNVFIKLPNSSFI